MKFELKIVLVIAIVLVALGAIVFMNKSNPTPESLQEGRPCLVTLFGQEYDVTNFRKVHQGGDIFVCGTDNTDAYKQQHGSDISLIKKYLK